MPLHSTNPHCDLFVASSTLPPPPQPHSSRNVHIKNGPQTRKQKSEKKTVSTRESVDFTTYNNHSSPYPHSGPTAITITAPSQSLFDAHTRSQLMVISADTLAAVDRRYQMHNAAAQRDQEIAMRRAQRDAKQHQLFIELEDRVTVHSSRHQRAAETIATKHRSIPKLN